MAYIQNGKVSLISRNLQDFSALFRPIAESLEAIAVPLFLDGEVVALDARGRPDFEALLGPGLLQLHMGRQRHLLPRAAITDVRPEDAQLLVPEVDRAGLACPPVQVGRALAPRIGRTDQGLDVLLQQLRHRL